MSYFIYDSNGYVGDLCSNNGLNELKQSVGKKLPDLFGDGYVEITDKFKSLLDKIDSSDKTVKNLISLAKKCEDIVIITDGFFSEDEDEETSETEEPQESKVLRPNNDSSSFGHKLNTRQAGMEKAAKHKSLELFAGEGHSTKLYKDYFSTCAG